MLVLLTTHVPNLSTALTTNSSWRRYIRGLWIHIAGGYFTANGSNISFSVPNMLVSIVILRYIQVKPVGRRLQVACIATVGTTVQADCVLHAACAAWKQVALI